jgi:hypothetical protein
MWSTATTAAAVCKFCIGAADDEDVLRGVVVVGRPVARMLDDALTLEVTRTATDGTRNACSLLYAAAWRAAKALGYQRLVTRTQRGETGASLGAAGGRSSRTGRRMPGGTGVLPPARCAAPRASCGRCGRPCETAGRLLRRQHNHHWPDRHLAPCHTTLPGHGHYVEPFDKAHWFPVKVCVAVLAIHT